MQQDSVYEIVVHNTQNRDWQGRIRFPATGEEQPFTSLLELLMLNKEAYLSTEDLLVKVWGYDTEAEVGTVWVYISYLRKRLSALNANVTIAARRNVGYRLEEAK